MNILIDKLPDTVEVDGSLFSLRADFRVWIMFELLMQDRMFTESERVIAALNLCYEVVPDDLEQAVEHMLWFYSCGKIGKSREDSSGESSKEIYSFKQDDDYIYAAFLCQYGIDLQDTDLHWWKFKAMFKGLGEDNQIVKIMGFRAMTIDSTMSAEQKEYYNNMKLLYALDDDRSDNEKAKDFEQDLLGGL